MTKFRGRSLLAAFIASRMLAFAGPAAAQTDEECTLAAVSNVLKTFPTAMKLSLECEMSWLTSEDATCDSSRTEKVDARLSDAIGDSCSGGADILCASTAADQYGGLIRASMSQGVLPEPDQDRLLCRETIVLAGEKLARKSAKLARKCNMLALAGDPAYGPAGDTCTDTAGTIPLKIGRAQEKLRKALARRCGGADRSFGGGDDMDPQDDLGFAETCRGGPDCVNPAPGLAELAECVICTAAQEVGEAATGALALPLDPIQSCRVRLDHYYSNFADDMLSAHWRCHDEVLDDPLAPACPSEWLLSEIEQQEIAVETRVASYCSSLDPQDVGFPATCPDVGSCAAIDVSELAGQIDCLTCVTKARVEELVDAVFVVSAFEPDAAKLDCRAAIGEQLIRQLARDRMTALRRCDRRRNCGITTDACPDEGTIERMTESVLRAQEAFYYCWGPGPAPFDPQDLGYDVTCPDLLGCGGQETDTLAGLSACLVCLANSTADDLRSTYSPWP